MKSLAELLAMKAALVAKLKALHEGNEVFSKEQDAEYAGIKAEIDAVNKQIERKQDLEKMLAAQATPVKDQEPVGEDTEAVEKEARVFAPLKEQEKGFAVGAMVLASMASMGQGVQAAKQFCVKKYGERHEITKTLQAGTTPGSILVPTDYGPEVIELLRDKTIVRGMNARHIGLPLGNMTIPRQNSGVNAGYVGEKVARDAETLGLDSITLSAKKLMSVTSLTSEMLADNAYGAEGIARDDLIASMAQKEDGQLIRGAASATEPTSIKELADGASRSQAAASIAGASGAALVQIIQDDLGVLQLALEEANIESSGCIWMMAPRTRAG